MRLKRLLAGALVGALTLTTIPATEIIRAEEVETYTFTDRKGVTVTVPVTAFAIRVVDFVPGDPWTTVEQNQDPEAALGLPDFDQKDDTYKADITLGKKGVLTLELGSYIDDRDGDDVYIFEDGPEVESIYVAISNDLETWYEIGRVEGTTAGLDINGKVPEGDVFKYVRLTDTGENGGGTYAGADIDAVCGLNTIEEDAVDIGDDDVGQVMNVKLVNKKVKRMYISYDPVEDAEGYEIQYSNSSSMDNYKAFTTKAIKGYFKNSKGTKVSFKKGKTYYVRVRAFITDEDGERIFGEWSDTQNVTIAK